MVLKRECDRCGHQEVNGATALFTTVELPDLPPTPFERSRKSKRIDVCHNCARAICKAADPVPYAVVESERG